MRKRTEEYKQYQKEWAKQNKDKRAVAHQKYLETSPEKKLLKSSKYNAKAKGLEHTITLADIIIPDKCPYLSVPLSKRIGDRYGVSLDRVDPTKGYIPGNVLVVSKLANRMKSDATIDELLAFAANIEIYFVDLQQG